MPRKTIHGIDPYTPGSKEALLAHHRLTFGNAVMEAGEGGEGGQRTDTGTGTDVKGAEAQEADKAAERGGKIVSLPPAQKIITDLR